ncbi:hypothetical protein L3X38_011304 [Prunus dulcis]|uniref:Uncharacterized protein n=1 Tax=Prunus dulcis TaxID=3755 RepID=A0AAD4WH52_PRUDU|nr:hypothetical protein L3X38_011304 [Prunus dulcis]
MKLHVVLLPRRTSNPDPSTPLILSIPSSQAGPQSSPASEIPLLSGPQSPLAGLGDTASIRASIPTCRSRRYRFYPGRNPRSQVSEIPLLFELQSSLAGLRDTSSIRATILARRSQRYLFYLSHNPRSQVSEIPLLSEPQSFLTISKVTKGSNMPRTHVPFESSSSSPNQIGSRMGFVEEEEKGKRFREGCGGNRAEMVSPKNDGSGGN